MAESSAARARESPTGPQGPQGPEGPERPERPEGPAEGPAEDLEDHLRECVLQIFRLDHLTGFALVPSLAQIQSPQTRFRAAGAGPDPWAPQGAGQRSREPVFCQKKLPASRACAVTSRSGSRNLKVILLNGTN